MTTDSGQADKRVSTEADVSRLAKELGMCLEHASLVEAGPQVDVYRAVWQNRSVVLRLYKYAGLIRSLWRTLTGSQAHCAFAHSRRLLDLGIPVPRPLACVEQRRGPLSWQSWLVTESIEGPPLSEVLRDTSVPEGRKRRLIHQALRLANRLRSHRVSCQDVKPTDVRCDAGQIVLTNPDGMEIHQLGSLPWHQRSGDLVRSFCGLGEERGTGVPESTFIEVRRPGGRLWMNADFRNSDLEDALWSEPRVLAERFRPQTIQSSAASRVYRFTTSFNGVPTSIYLKEYLDRSAWDLLKHAFRPSRAVRAMRASEMLRMCGFQAPQVVAAGNLRRKTTDSDPSARKSQTSRCFLATCEVAGVLPIHKYVMPVPGRPLPCSSQERRELLRQYGMVVGRMHRLGIVHGDLRSGNVLVRKGERGWEFFLIDNERTRRHRHLLDHLRRKNLVQVNLLPWGISNTDRLRFFLAYLLLDPAARPGHRRYARKVMAVTRKRLLAMKKEGRIDRAMRDACAEQQS